MTTLKDPITKSEETRRKRAFSPTETKRIYNTVYQLRKKGYEVPKNYFSKISKKQAKTTEGIRKALGIKTTKVAKPPKPYKAPEKQKKTIVSKMKKFGFNIDEEWANKLKAPKNRVEAAKLEAKIAKKSEWIPPGQKGEKGAVAGKKVLEYYRNQSKWKRQMNALVKAGVIDKDEAAMYNPWNIVPLLGKLNSQWTSEELTELREEEIGRINKVMKQKPLEMVMSDRGRTIDNLLESFKMHVESDELREIVSNKVKELGSLKVYQVIKDAEGTGKYTFTELFGYKMILEDGMLAFIKDLGIDLDTYLESEGETIDEYMQHFGDVYI